MLCRAIRVANRIPPSLYPSLQEIQTDLLDWKERDGLQLRVGADGVPHRYQDRPFAAHAQTRHGAKSGRVLSGLDGDG